MLALAASHRHLGPRRMDYHDHYLWLRLRLCAPPVPGRLARIEALATLLDTALVIPGTNVRFGLDALIGLFPAVGDTKCCRRNAVTEASFHVTR
jgi:hypothetical protein